MDRYDNYPEAHSAPAASSRVRQREEGTTLTRRGPIDLPFLFLVLIILSIGVIMVFSASFASAYYSEDDATKYLRKQLIFAFLGVAGMVTISYFPSTFFRRISTAFLIFTLLMLALVPYLASARLPWARTAGSTWGSPPSSPQSSRNSPSYSPSPQ